jgi:hypothetical protein
MPRLLLALGLLELTVGVMGFVWFGPSLSLLARVLVQDTASGSPVNEQVLLSWVVLTAVAALLVGTGVFGVSLGLTRLPKRLGVTPTGRILFMLGAGAIVVSGLGMTAAGAVGYSKLPQLVESPYQDTFVDVTALSAGLLTRGLSVMILMPLLGFAGILIGLGDPRRGSRREVSYIPIFFSLLAGLAFIAMFVLCHIDCVHIKSLLDVGNPAPADLAWYVANVQIRVATAGACLVVMGGSMLATVLSLPSAETETHQQRAMRAHAQR